MTALTAIFTRRSVRAFSSEPLTDQQVECLLAAGMAAPSAGNAQPWEFILLRDKQLLEKIPAINPYAAFAPQAPLGILICGNTTREKYAGFWIEDTSAATQNILLAAHALGLGACWTGIYPMQERVQGFRQLVGAPEYVLPMAFVSVGYPRKAVQTSVDRYKSDRVHHNVWGQQ
ncbi:MAG: nitroreductase family protein [Desulfovibrio sp.]|nr:nitroreductase family protein [Desulfovibrio sp.]